MLDSAAELTALSIAEAAPRLRDGSLSPVELTQAHLDRIARLDPALNTFITLCAERALDQARLAGAELRAGDYRGPLHGIPIALKDLYETAGVRTTAGSEFLAEHVPERDCAVAEKLRAAGAILLGKLNMHEWAFGVTNVNKHFGACRNPWTMPPRPAFIPGGSSGGSGAALAAGLCMGSMGSDTRGSIRIPSSLCGVVGLKPSYGRVSLRGVIPLGWSLDHAGPMARCVEDVALLFQAVAGYDPLDPASDDQPVPHVLTGLKAGVAGLRVAAPDDKFFRQAHPDVLAAVDAALEVFTALGAEVRRVDLGWLAEAGRASRILLGAEAAAFHRERLESAPDRFDPAILARMQRDSAASAADYAALRHVGLLGAHRLGQCFDDHDVIVLPATPLPAVPIDELGTADAGYNWTQFTAPFNMTGTPALALPCGFTGDGLPVGLQIAGPAWGEALVLRAGYAFEAATTWRKMPVL
jgi:aspartyl-tRNA(Asn)/glutamyl-tRNA(Gln) amidotransferase subunit A